MVDRFHLHLGYEITLAMHHNEIDNRVGVIFATPYISQLIRGMGLRGGVSGMRIGYGSDPIILDTFRTMRMVQAVRTTHLRPLIMSLIEQYLTIHLLLQFYFSLDFVFLLLFRLVLYFI